MSETTTKATHTAGRWKFSLSQDGDLITKAEVTDADRRRICTVSLRADQSEVEPNMRLMAAAPDLLAALIAARDHLNYCNYGDQWENECARNEKLPEKISTALAKAGVEC